jgi:hypothetical protein
MEYLKHQNEALKRELIDLLHLTIQTNEFLEMVHEDLKKHGLNDDIEYVELLIQASKEKIFKLKILIDG